MSTTSNFIDLCATAEIAEGEIHRGSLPDGHAVAIYNALSRHAGTVTVWIDGIAASAASYVTMAGDEIVISHMEHHANIVPWHFLRERQGVVIKWVDVDANGDLDPQAVIDAMTCALGADYATVHRGVYGRSAQMTLGYEAARRRDPAFTCAKLFWWYNMYASADISVTPRPMYPADGRKIPDVYT